MKPDGAQNKSSTPFYGVFILAINFIAMILLLAGCASYATKAGEESSSKPEHVITAPTDFISKTAFADQLIISPISQDPLFKDLRLTLTGKNAKDVIKAISLLKNDRIVDVGYPSCNCENWKLEIYRGTNYLGTALFVEDAVQIDDEYRDYTGTFKKLDNEISDKMDVLILRKYP